MPRILAAVGAALLLAACSTSVKETLPLGGGPLPASAGPVQVRTVTGRATARVPQNLVPQLSRAIQLQLAAAPGGGAPADLQFDVLEYRERSAQARAIAGVFMGGDRIRVVVTLRDPAGATLRTFEVDRKSNPGGFGALIDQQQALTDAVAKQIAVSLGVAGQGRR